MIFVTVGTQLPFPRLIDAIDAIAGRHGLDVVAQTGPYDGNASHIRCFETLGPAEFESHFTAAEKVVAHAGIGSILSAKRYQRPLIVLPRRHALAEHRNDHQLATARGLEQVTGIHVAWEEDALEELVLTPDLPPAGEDASPGRDRLIGRLRDFIETGR